MSIVGNLIEEFSSKRKASSGFGNKPGSWSKATAQSCNQVDLLGALCDHLVFEEPRLVFNYASMTIRCYNLLRELRKMVSDKLLECCGSDYISKDSELPLVVPFIFHNAVYSAEVAPALKLGPEKESFSIMVMRAGNILRNFTKRNGAVACIELRAFCREKEEIPTLTGTDTVLQEGKDYHRVPAKEAIDDLADADLEIGVRQKINPKD